MELFTAEYFGAGRSLLQTPFVEVPQQHQPVPPQHPRRAPPLDEELEQIAENVHVLQKQPKLEPHQELLLQLETLLQTVERQIAFRDKQRASENLRRRFAPLQKIVEREHALHDELPPLLQTLLQFRGKIDA